MKMRAKRRATRARHAGATVPDGLAEVVDTLTAVRRARVALLRNPVALAEIQHVIQTVPRPQAKILRRMLAEDLKLMRIMDRQERRQSGSKVTTLSRARN